MKLMSSRKLKGSLKQLINWLRELNVTFLINLSSEKRLHLPRFMCVYDTSAKAHPNAVSLNDRLYPGPTLQNKMWNVLVRSRVHPIAVVGDLKQAFLQVRIREADRDALRFHWEQTEHSEIETLRFTRALFGLAPSPFLLSGVIEHHLDTWEAREPHVVAELQKSLHTDDLISEWDNSRGGKGTKGASY